MVKHSTVHSLEKFQDQKDLGDEDEMYFFYVSSTRIFVNVVLVGNST